MRRGKAIAALVCIGLLSIVAVGAAQTSDGPYFIVDNTVTTAWGHVYPNLAAAIAAVTTPPGGVNPAEMAGATIVLYPGQHSVPATGLAITTPDLRIISRDGADKTVLNGLGGASVLTVAAPGVSISDISIVAPAGCTAITISDRDCTLNEVVATGAGAGAVVNGIVLIAGSDNARLNVCQATGFTGDGINIGGAAPVWDVEIRDCVFRSNGGSGITLASAHRISITASALIGNTGNGILIAGPCEDVLLEGCDLSSNLLSGASVAAASQLELLRNSYRRNVGAAVLMAGTSSVSVVGSVFEQNTTQAISLTAGCSGVLIEGNTIRDQAAFGVPPVPAITLGGAETACRIIENSVSGYGIGLDFLPTATASGNEVSGNTITATTGDGIRVQGSGGSNIFSGNELQRCGGNGIHVQASAIGDRYTSNTVEACTLHGVAIDDAGGAAVVSLTLSGNSIQGCGQDGVSISSTGGPGVGPILVRGNSVLESNMRGLAINAPAPTAYAAGSTIVGLRIESNLIVGSEGEGLSFTAAPGCLITGNTIAESLDVGIRGTHAVGGAQTRILLNSIHDNDGGGLDIGLAGAPGVIIERNAIYRNQAFGASLSTLPGPGQFAVYPEGFSLGQNWWGVPTGPAGFFGGSGNAVLGVTGAAVVGVAPVLPAPVTTGPSESSLVLRYAQVSVVPTFAATGVKVDRRDTSGVRLVFSDVESRSSGQVNTALYTEHAVDNLLPPSPGKVVRAVAILLAGFDTGTAEVSLEFDPSLLSEEEVEGFQVYGLAGGVWTPSENAEWRLEGGAWEELGLPCPVPGTNLMVIELPVDQLQGKYLALALVSPPVGE